MKDDAAYGPGIRCLTVVSPEDPDGTELLLTPLDDAAKALRATRRESKPALSFTTEDCQRTYDQLRERGVTFLSEPREMSYGGIDAVFQDGCGNLISLHQETQAGTGG